MNINSFVYLDRIRPLVLALPATTEGSCYGTPGFRVKKKLLARLHEDGETLVVYTEDRETWISAKPAVFYFTEHYRNSFYMLVRLKKVSNKDLAAVLLAAWRLRAPKLLLKEYAPGKKDK